MVRTYKEARIMNQRNQKDGSQAGRQAGGRGRNLTDKCRHPGKKNKR